MDDKLPAGKTTKQILLVTRVNLLHDLILANAGYSVITVRSIAEARRAWQPGRYALVLISALDTTREAEEFCEELKSIYPPQSVALLTGWNTFLPKDSCPDETISREEGPAMFVSRVKEMLAKPSS